MNTGPINRINNNSVSQNKSKKTGSEFSQTLEKTITKKDQKFDDIFVAAGKKWNVDPSLLKAIARAESNFNPLVKSKAGACGIMQLMPSTARSLGVKNVFDPKENIFGGARYIRSMLDQFNDTKLALAAYNAGPGAVKKYGGIPPYKETQKYVNKVLSFMDKEDLLLSDTKVSRANNTGTSAGAGTNSISVTSGNDLPASDYINPSASVEIIKLWIEIMLAQSILNEYKST
ncbi:MAG: lytic transglycosylase domain-containing protein [Bacillota bacterium]|jgi:soluble lytic murein transglycosylase-like protein